MTEVFTLAGALVLGSFGFWAFWGLVIIVSMIFIALAENEKYWMATAVWIGAFVALSMAGIFNIIDFTWTHPWSLVQYALEYFAIGAVWGVFKWWRYVRYKANEYDAAQETFLKKIGRTAMDEEAKFLWTKALNEHDIVSYNSDGYRAGYLEATVPAAKDNKVRITGWMYMWPFSMVGYFCGRMIKEVWNWIYRNVVQFCDYIAQKVWADRSGHIMTTEQFAAYKKGRIQEGQNDQ